MIDLKAIKPQFGRDNLLVLLYFSIFALIPLVYIRFFIFVREETFLFVFFNGLIFMLPILLGITKSRIYILLTGSILAGFSLIQLLYALVFKGSLTKHMFFIIFNTNSAETSEFLKDHVHTTSVIMTVLYIAVFLLFSYIIIKKKKLELKKSFASVVYFIIFPLLVKIIDYNVDFKRILTTYERANTPLRFVLSLNEYYEHINFLKSANAATAPPIKGLKKVIPFSENETHILVIGEATTSNRMSLYGHYRKTNPILEAMKSELLVFKNVQATKPPVTDVNVPRILTLAEYGVKNKNLFKISIIKVMKELGYKTYWLSNQGSIGHKITFITAIGMAADAKSFTSSANKFNKDDRIFPVLNRYLNETSVRKKFIIIHINGTHNTYSHRYTKEFDVFKSKDDIPKQPFHNSRKLALMNEYDNAVLYNDWIISEILKKLKSQKGIKSLVYIPDHGEEVYETADQMGHGQGYPTSGKFNIPLIMWIDSEYKKNLNLDFPLDRPYTSDKLIHSLLDLYHIKAPFYKATDSLFSSEFVPSNIIKFSR